MNMGAIYHWAKAARPCETLTYHRGWHLFEPRAEPETIEAVRVLYNDGLIELVQKRHGPRDYEYLAVRRLDRDRSARKRFDVSKKAEAAWRLATGGKSIGPNRL